MSGSVITAFPHELKCEPADCRAPIRCPHTLTWGICARSSASRGKSPCSPRRPRAAGSPLSLGYPSRARGSHSGPGNGCEWIGFTRTHPLSTAYVPNGLDGQSYLHVGGSGACQPAAITYSVGRVYAYLDRVSQPVACPELVEDWGPHRRLVRVGLQGGQVAQEVHAWRGE